MKEELAVTGRFVKSSHTPKELQSLLPPKVNDIITRQNLLQTKKILGIFFANSKQVQFKGDSIIIPGEMLSDSLKGRYSITDVERVFKHFKTQVDESNKRVSRDLQKASPDSSFFMDNWVRLLPEDVDNLLGRKVSTPEYHVIIQSIQPQSHGMLKIVMGSIWFDIRERLNKSLDSYERLIVTNIKHVLKFKSEKALSLYYFINKLQHYTNFVEVDVDELMEILKIKPAETQKLKRFTDKLREIVQDPVLVKTNCALKKAPGGKQYFVTLNRRTPGKQKIRMEFKSNQELAEDMLALDYKFIKHLKQTNMTMPGLVQIIARVQDNFIEEGYINYLINKIYETKKRRETKNFYEIGGLIIDSINNNRYQDYKEHPELCELTDTPGVSMGDEIIKMKKDSFEIIIPPKKTSGQPDKKRVAALQYLKSLSGLEGRYIDYVEAEMDPGKMLDKINNNPNKSVRAKDTVILFVLNDFKLSQQDNIIDALKKIGFPKYQAEKLLNLPGVTLLDTVFRYYDIAHSRILIPSKSFADIKEYCEPYLADL